MKRLVAGLLSALLMTVAFVSLSATNVQAVDVINNGDGPCSGASGVVPDFCNDSTSEDPVNGSNGIMTKIIQVMAILVGIVAVIMLIVSGIRLAASAGNEQAVKSARTGIIYALVGLAVAVAAQAIVTFVIGKV